MSDEKTGFLETKNADGTIEKSSKRLIGVIAFSIGGAIMVALGIVSFFTKTADSETIITIGTSFLITGASLLGIGVLEGIGKK